MTKPHAHDLSEIEPDNKRRCGLADLTLEVCHTPSACYSNQGGWHQVRAPERCMLSSTSSLSRTSTSDQDNCFGTSKETGQCDTKGRSYYTRTSLEIHSGGGSVPSAVRTSSRFESSLCTSAWRANGRVTLLSGFEKR